jgi:hypothetical protein
MQLLRLELLQFLWYVEFCCTLARPRPEADNGRIRFCRRMQNSLNFAALIKQSQNSHFLLRFDSEREIDCAHDNEIYLQLAFPVGGALQRHKGAVGITLSVVMGTLIHDD